MATYKNNTNQALIDYGTSGNSYTFQPGETKTITEIIPLPLTVGLTIVDFNGYSPIIYSGTVAASTTVQLPQIPLNPMGLATTGVPGSCTYRIRIYGISGSSTVQFNGVGTALNVPAGVMAWDRMYNSRVVDNMVVTVGSGSIWICVEAA